MADMLIHVFVFLLGVIIGLLSAREWQRYLLKQEKRRIERRKKLERILKKRALIRRALRRREIKRSQAENDNIPDRQS